MYVRGVHGFSAEGFCSSGMYWHVRPPNCGKNAQRIRGCLFERGVAMDCAYAEEVQARIMGSEEDGEGVLKAVLAHRRTGLSK